MQLSDFRPPRWLKPPRGYSNRTIHMYDRKDRPLCGDGLNQSVGEEPKECDVPDLCLGCWETLVLGGGVTSP